MRKFLTLVFCIFLLVISSPATAYAASSIVVTLNGEIIQLGVDQPILEKGRVLIPLRSIFEKMGALVDWNGQLKRVNIQKGTTRIWLPLEGENAYINGVGYQIDVLPRLVKGRTYVPLRFISQALGAAVNWDGAAKSVAINMEKLSFQKEVWGYYVDHNSYPSLENNLDLVNAMLPFSYKLNKEGLVEESVYFPQGHNLAKDNNIPVYALVFADDQALLSKNLEETTSRSALVEQIFSILEQRGYQGVNLDFERLGAGDRDNYTKLVRELAERLNPAGYRLTISVPAKAHDNFSWTKGYDYAALGSSADTLIIMAYDQHYSGSNPGPVAALEWVESVVQYGTSQVDSGKLLLGLGLYGYDWPEGQKARTLDLDGISKIQGAEQSFSEKYYSPYLTYTDSAGIKHQVWYEDQQSIQGKLELVKKYQLGGYALWRLGIIPEGIWETLRLFPN